MSADYKVNGRSLEDVNAESNRPGVSDLYRR